MTPDVMADVAHHNGFAGKRQVRAFQCNHPSHKGNVQTGVHSNLIGGVEATINAEAFNALPPDLQAIVVTACKAANLDMHAQFEARNGEALKKLLDEHAVELRPFPDDVLTELKRASIEVIEEQAAADEMSGKVWTSIKTYMEQVKPWTEIGSQYFVNRR